jgi:hypothetical protein
MWIHPRGGVDAHVTHEVVQLATSLQRRSEAAATLLSAGHRRSCPTGVAGILGDLGLDMDASIDIKVRGAVA